MRNNAAGSDSAGSVMRAVYARTRLSDQFV
jgi:hypothetical protein